MTDPLEQLREMHKSETNTFQDRVLAKIDDEIDNVQVWLESIDEVWTSETALDDARKHLRFMRALRAVVEIHHLRHYKPGFRDVKGTLHFEICSGCSDRAQEPVQFPCYELSAIAKELGVGE